MYMVRKEEHNQNKTMCKRNKQTLDHGDGDDDDDDLCFINNKFCKSWHVQQTHCILQNSDKTGCIIITIQLTDKDPDRKAK